MPILQAYSHEFWPTSASDCAGLEFDWFATDRVGQLGVFCSAGTWLIPVQVFSSLTAYNCLITAITSRPTAPATLELNEAGHFQDWREYAERGMFAYDFHDVHRPTSPERNGYDLIYRPSNPATITELSDSVIKCLPRLDIVFGDSDLVPLPLIVPLC